MTHLLYFDTLNREQKYAIVLITVIVGFGESLIILFALNYYFIAYALASISAYLLGRIPTDAWASLSRKNLPPLPDVLLYLLVPVETLLISLIPKWAELEIPPPKIIPQIFSRIDLELFFIAFAILIIAVLWPSLNDLRTYKNFLAGKVPQDVMFRLPPDYLGHLPPDGRRWRRAVASLTLFAVITFLLLIATQNLWASALVILIYLALAPSLFKYAYGYRSHIIGVFGRTLFAVVIAGCILNSNFAPRVLANIPSEIIAQLNSLTSVLGAVLAVAGPCVFQILRPGSNRLLVADQAMGHVAYFLSLWLGQSAIYWFWIIPLTTT